MEAVAGLFLMMFGVVHGELFKFMSFINISFYSQRVVVVVVVFKISHGILYNQLKKSDNATGLDIVEV